MIKNLESDTFQNGSIFLEYQSKPRILSSLVRLTILIIKLLYPGPEVPGGFSVEKIFVNFSHFSTLKMQFSQAHAIMTHSNSQWVCNS